jgi:hypothetical protein
VSEYGNDFQPSNEGNGEPESSPAPTKKRGPKPMTDEPTVRIEGQLFPHQYDAATVIVNRLKIENRDTPSGERRRMTINTLVRLGMTIVLEHEAALHGRSEDELMDALRRSIESRNGGDQS